MSYNNIEKSVDLGAPVTLFEFIYGQTTGDAYRYSTTVDEVTLAGRAWRPHNLTHSDIVSTGKLDKAELTVTARPDIDVAALFLSSPPSQPVMLNIWRGHSLTATSGWDEFVRVWVGRVLSCQWAEDKVQFKCEPVATSAKRVGLRRHYQYGCPHVLYGRACGVSELANTTQIRVIAVASQLQLTIAATGAGGPAMVASELVGGIFTLQLLDGRQARRTIVSAAVSGGGIALRLMSSLPELAVGSYGAATRGCQHTFAACKTFNNTSNYGGCPSIPTKDPFHSNTF